MPVRRSRPAPRPVPERSAEFDHLSVESLRRYRRALTDEEGRVSYWRRIIQARLDLSRSGTGGTDLDLDALGAVLASAQNGPGRGALVELLPVDDIPPLRGLAELWARRPVADDPAGTAALQDELAEAESELSALRGALHRRLGDATAELIARYREEPTLCLSALPLRLVTAPLD